MRSSSVEGRAFEITLQPASVLGIRAVGSPASGGPPPQHLAPARSSPRRRTSLASVAAALSLSEMAIWRAAAPICRSRPCPAVEEPASGNQSPGRGAHSPTRRWATLTSKSGRRGSKQHLVAAGHSHGLVPGPMERFLAGDGARGWYPYQESPSRVQVTSCSRPADGADPAEPQPRSPAELAADGRARPGLQLGLASTRRCPFRPPRASRRSAVA